MRIPVNAFRLGGLTEAEFNGVIDKVSAVIEPMITQRGGKLTTNRLWDDETVNASAERNGDEWIVNMYGGLARHSETTVDGFTLVLCHELGHHLGGAPLYMWDDWAADEGQADYWGNLKCVRKVWEHDNNAAAVAAMTVDSTLASKCSATYAAESDKLICERAGMAGMSLGRLLTAITNDGAWPGEPLLPMPEFTTPDASQVSSTYDGHPEPQCRLDTYYAAALCTVAHSVDTDLQDATIGTCNQEKGDAFGFRPRCWYKPAAPVGPAPAALRVSAVRY